MRAARLPLLCFIGWIACAGCGDDGGDDDDDDDDVVDAAVAGLTGLGQLCGLNQDVCPDEAQRCVLVEGGGLTGFCTADCVTDGTFDTDARRQPQNVTPALSTGDGVCTALYTGEIGTGACKATVAVEPDLPLQPDTDYVFTAACVIECGAGDACPGDLTCDTAVGYCVAP